MLYMRKDILPFPSASNFLLLMLLPLKGSAMMLPITPPREQGLRRQQDTGACAIGMLIDRGGQFMSSRMEVSKEKSYYAHLVPTSETAS